MKHRRLLNAGILLVVIIIAAVFAVNDTSRSTSFYGDALGYYMYLPATFIYHNLETIDELPKDKGIDDGVLWYAKHVRDQPTPTGKALDQYTYGVALMESPFFFAAHAYAKTTGAAASGYSKTYDYLVKFSSFFYALLGLILVYKILKRYFTNTLALSGVAIIFLGTNLFWFSIYQAGMSHVPLFFLYSLLLYLVIKVHDHPKTFLFVSIGLVCGIITLIRPTDILCALIPLLYNVYNKATISKKVLFLRQNILNICTFTIAAILPIAPQLIYWKAITGSYFYYSYGSQGFNWLHPKIIEGLFYFSNGWFPYSPVMIFSVLGLLLYGSFKKWALSIWVILPLYIYIIYSWYCYNYINGLGSRPMIHLYPLLALPLTAFIQFISKQRLFIKTSLAIICLFFIALNISYSMQESKGILVSPVSNIKYNMQMAFRMHLRYNDLVVKDIWAWQPDANSVTKLSTLACKNYSDSIPGGNNPFHTADSIHEVLSIPYNKETFKNAKWFKCSGRFMYRQAPGYYRHLLVLSSGNKLWRGCTIENKIGDWKTSGEDIRLDHFETNKWGYMYYYVKIPKTLHDGDTVKLSILNPDKLDLYMDDVCLELYR